MKYGYAGNDMKLVKPCSVLVWQLTVPLIKSQILVFDLHTYIYFESQTFFISPTGIVKECPQSVTPSWIQEKETDWCTQSSQNQKQPAHPIANKPLLTQLGNEKHMTWAMNILATASLCNSFEII